MTKGKGALFSLALLAAGCGGAGDPTAPATAMPTPTPAAVASRAGLVLLFHFEQSVWTGAANEVVDSSGASHHGTALPGASTVAGGKFGRGAVFGPRSGVRVADGPELRPASQLTLAAWILPSGLGRGNALGIIAKRVDYLVDSAYSLYISPEDRLTADVDTEDDRFSGPTLGEGAWRHVALVYDGSLEPAARSRLYIDGRLVGLGLENAAAIRPFASPLWIGCLPLTVADQSFGGMLDEVAVWHRALPAAEIERLAGDSAPIPD